MAARALTPGEWSELSPGLAAALEAAGVTPRIEDRPYFAARLVQWRYRSIPILALADDLVAQGAR